MPRSERAAELPAALASTGERRRTLGTGGGNALSFDYGLGTLQFDALGATRPFYQLVSSLCSTGGFGDYGGCEQFDNGSDHWKQHVLYSLRPAADTVVLATAAAVPKPAVWLLMIGGFGVVGSAGRTRAARPA